MRRKSAAFTLVEVLVAMAVFAMLAALAYGTLSRTLANAELLTERMERLQAVQRTLRFLAEDFQQLAPRPVRDELGDNFVPALRTDTEAGFGLELTRGGWSNPIGLPRGTLQRVGWRLEEDRLVRYHWNVLDRTLNSEPLVQVMLDEVDEVTLRFMQDNGEWVDRWPAAEPLGPLPLRLRPRAVEIVLTMADESELTRLLEVAP